MEPLHWIAGAGFGGIVTAIWANLSRKTDAAKDREQRGRIAADQLAIANRQADIAAQAVADAAADRKQQAAIEERRAKIEERRAKEADGTLNALTELIRRTAPPSPPGATEDKPDTTASPNPNPGQDGADSKGAGRAAGPAHTGADSPAMNGAHLSPDTLKALFGTDDPDKWMEMLGPILWERGSTVSPDVMVKAIQERMSTVGRHHPDRDRGESIIAFIRETGARSPAA